MQENQSWKLVYFCGPWGKELNCTIRKGDEAALRAHWLSHS